jgi:hypothetical protein
MPIRLPFGIKVLFESQGDGGDDRVHPADAELTDMRRWA